jgi:general secretion pathway protein K
MKRYAQHGAAIVMAMLTVVLVATMASVALWQQWRAVEVESAERTRAQATWVLMGALDWARLILKEDARKGGADHLAEPWALALEQARLSTFLATDRSSSLDGDASQNAFLSGHMVDLQSRLNITNLVQDGKVHGATVQMFARLFDQLGLDPRLLETMLAQLLLSVSDKPQAPLRPQDLDQLAWLGVDADSIERLRPFVTLLPERTPVNLNTASPLVLVACLGIHPAAAQQLVQARNLNPWDNMEAVRAVAPPGLRALETQAVSTQSRFFELRGTLQIDKHTVHETSVVQRDGLQIKTLWRKRTIGAAAGKPRPPTYNGV